MKTTGMVRRIDELGRIVIPKEIRKQLMMKEGESISFSLKDDRIILTKYSLLNKLSPVIQSLLDGFYQKYHNTMIVCDLDTMIITSSRALSTYQRKSLPIEVKEALMRDEFFKENELNLEGYQKVTLFPLKQENQVIGGLLMLSEQTPFYKVDETLIEFVKNVIEQEIDACV